MPTRAPKPRAPDGFRVVRRAGSSFLLLCGALLSAIAPAAVAEDPIPHVGERAREHFQSYRYAEDHRAFAIAPGGAWAWQAGLTSPDAARDAALEACAGQTDQRCVLYAVGDDVVFDRARWPKLWRPYATAAEAREAPEGTRRGQRMPDLRFATADGTPFTLGDLRGRVVLLHFWGSWCPPCMRELPVLRRFASEVERQLGERVTLVLLQVREPFADAAAWVTRNGLEGLPLYDSGSTGTDDTDLRLADGRMLPDRELAARFPTSYVIGREGLVLFRHVGPIHAWDEYLPFFADAAR